MREIKGGKLFCAEVSFLATVAKAESTSCCLTVPTITKLPGWTSFAIDTGNDSSLCNTFLRSTDSWDTPCRAGGKQEMTISSASVEDSIGDNNSNGNGDSSSNDTLTEMKKGKKRAVRTD